MHAAAWSVGAVLLVPYLALRGAGDDAFTPHQVGDIERALFGAFPGRALQGHLYSGHQGWLEIAAYWAHRIWFFQPILFGFVITVWKRERLLEFMAWILVACYAGAFFFFFVPVNPPWMGGDAVRILTDAGFYGGLQIDTNPSAAFPSFHAMLPLVIALFFWVRVPRLRFCAYVAGIYSLVVGFAVVYLGEHWVIDVLAGYGLAGVVAWLMVGRHPRRLYARVPGDPVKKLAALNVWMFGPDRRDGLEDAEETPVLPVAA